LPSVGGYNGLENQLYRVEIHQEGSLGEATFKWSRDNGSVVVGVELLNGSEITVNSLGPDGVLGIDTNQWIELLDERYELRNIPGHIFRVVSVNPSIRVVQLDGTVSAMDIDMQRKPRLRRWDSNGVQTVKVPPENEGWIKLENGIEVKFTGNDFRTGDYWLIPARTATGNIEWSNDLFKSPFGIKHHYCRLALIQSNGNVQDCRHFFDPLTSHVQAIHITETNWDNDSYLTSEDFVQKGLTVTFDQPVDSLLPQLWGVNSSSRHPTAASFIVKLELPLNTSKAATVLIDDLNPWPPIFGEFILDGIITFEDQNNVIRWRPFELAKSKTKRQEPKILALDNFLQNSQPLRVRVSIKGNTIWSASNGHRIYLDGCALGKPPTSENKRIDFVFPSGIGMRTSEFESWFYLVKTVMLDRITLNPAKLSFNAGNTRQQKVTAQVSINSSSPIGGLEILLTFNTANAVDIAFMPQSITIAEGETSVTFDLAVTPSEQFQTNNTDRSAVVITTASLNGIQKSAQLEVSWQSTPG
jgi:hypothetical protein